MKTKLNQSKLKLAIASAIVAGSMGLSSTSYAAVATGTMTVSTSVAVACAMSVTGNIAFSAYDQTAGDDLQSTGTMTSTCTSGGAAVITMSQGTSPHASSTAAVPERQMTNGSDKLKYYLYGDSGYSVAWGDTSGTGKSFTGTGSAQTFTAYAEITAEQAVISGTYTDSVAVTLTY